MPQLAQNPNIQLKIIFIVHFVFISLSSIGHWTSAGYVYYNFVLILLLLWAIKEQDEALPLQLAIAVNGFSVIIDILLLIMGFPSYQNGREQFSAAMTILHLLVRPITTILLAKLLEARGGLPEGGISNIISGRHAESYEDIDRNTVPQSQPVQSGGYNPASAQRI